MGHVIDGKGFFGGDYNNKCDEYKQYILRHKNGVIQAYNEIMLNPEFILPSTIYGVPLTAAVWDATVSAIRSDIMSHDDSKWSDEEFEAYRRKFYPTANETNVSDDTKALYDSEFAEAWKHHFTNNYHHPLYWKWAEIDGDTGSMSYQDFMKLQVNGQIGIRKKAHPNAPKMPLFAIIHMICDWASFQYITGKSTMDWYESHAQDEKADMDFATVLFVDELMNNIFT